MKYLNPFTDFGFKKLFGDESNKDILMDFLNTLLQDEQSTIVNLTFIKNEQLGDQELDRRAIFDLYCENEQGEKFIVELQKTKQNFFKDRSVYYSTFPIREQAKKGEWNYQLEAVYTIGILDFVFDEDKDDPDKLLYKIKLTDVETQKIFYDKLTFVYLEMPKFTKSIDELENHFDRWLYVIRNLSRLESYPEQLQEKIFKKFFEVAEIGQLNQEARDAYDRSLKYYWDMNNTIDSVKNDAYKEGRKAGKQEGIRENAIATAHKLKQMNLPIPQIAATTNLTLDELAVLFNE